jgi:hypothetical protein
MLSCGRRGEGGLGMAEDFFSTFATEIGPQNALSLPETKLVGQ